MIRLPRDLANRVAHAVREAQQQGALPDFELPQVRVTRTNKPELGDFTTPIGMQIAGPARMRPDAIAHLIVDHFPASDYLGAVEAVGGYVNFRLSDRWLQAQVDAIIALGQEYGRLSDFRGSRAQVECVSANPTGPITVGRIRGGVIGDTVARILRALGYEVDLEYYYNDAGAQIDQLGASLRARYLQRLGRKARLPRGGYRGSYIYDLADELITESGASLAEISDLAPFKEFAVRKISAGQKRSLARIGIVFDSYFSEQSLYKDHSIDDVLEDLTAKGLVYSALAPERAAQSDLRPDSEEREATTKGPAVWLRMVRIRGAKKDVALVKSGGEPTYRLPDIAYHVNKLRRGFQLAVNVLGADHIEEAKDVKAAVGALGYDAERIQHIIHQFVNLVKKGRSQKMSTRRGEFVTLDHLVDQVGPDAVRFFMLARSPDSHIDFDLDLARRHSNENPVYYIQNAYVRCSSIARVAKERGLSPEGGDVTLLTDPRELALIRKLVELPEIIEEAAADLAPHKLAFWAHEDLARVFHPTYEEVRALHGDVPVPLAKARLKLYAATRIVLARVLDLTGMSAPEKM